MTRKTAFPSFLKIASEKRGPIWARVINLLGMPETLKARSMCPSRNEIEVEGRGDAR
jgi:hypothetical protein